jgi:hypothetical protein
MEIWRASTLELAMEEGAMEEELLMERGKEGATAKRRRGKDSARRERRIRAWLRPRKVTRREGEFPKS